MEQEHNVKVDVFCPTCKEARQVDYRMRWMIRVGKSSGMCRSCSQKARDSYLIGGEPWNKGLKGYNAGHKAYIVAYGEDNAFYGKKHTKEAKLKMRLAKLNKPRIDLRGEKHPNWKGGKRSKRGVIKGSLEYKIWRREVFERDEWTCCECHSIGGRLRAHHIKSQNKFPELTFDTNNGVTLCDDCHKLTPSYGRG